MLVDRLARKVGLRTRSWAFPQTVILIRSTGQPLEVAIACKKKKKKCFVLLPFAKALFVIDGRWLPSPLRRCSWEKGLVAWMTTLLEPPVILTSVLYVLLKQWSRSDERSSACLVSHFAIDSCPKLARLNRKLTLYILSTVFSNFSLNLITSSRSTFGLGSQQESQLIFLKNSNRDRSAALREKNLMKSESH